MNVLVVLPTPPFGLISAIVFGRVTAGCVRIRRSSSASSRSRCDDEEPLHLPTEPPRCSAWRRPAVDERAGVDVAALEPSCRRPVISARSSCRS